MNDINISVTEDKLEAKITITAEADSFPSDSEIQNCIAEARVVFGIDGSILKKLKRDKLSVSELLFAKGVQVEQGKDAELKYHVASDFSLKPAVTESNRVNFKKLKLFEYVKKGQSLVIKTPASKGVEGKNVFGEKISMPGNDVNLPAGNSAYVSDDGLTLYAAGNGYAVFEDGLLHINKIYHVKGDVNYGTGNIKFKGPVVIEGDVRSGFRVEATESIYIKGNVGASSVYSQYGDITVHCGILGKNRAKLLAGGSLICGYIQDATIGVRKDVIIDHYAINSTISAGGKVSLEKNEGLIRGGSVTAEKGIIALNIGSKRNVYTELKIRNHSENENQTQLWQLSRERAELMVRVSSLNKRLSFLSLLDNNISNLSVEKKEEKLFLTDEIMRLEEKVAELGQMELNLQRETSKAAINKEIKALDTLHSNVNIDIGGIGFYTDKAMQGVKIFRFKKEMLIETLLDMNSSEYDIFVPANENF